MEIVVTGNKLRCGALETDCTVGRNGFASQKREGDGCTPVGTFYFREAFYRADRIPTPDTELPLRAITSVDGWCDAPDDEKYNQHVYLPYPASHEELWREDHLYDLVVVIGYNDSPIVNGAGSAIFMHVADPLSNPTQGCVAMEIATLQEVVKQITTDTTIVIQSVGPQGQK